MFYTLCHSLSETSGGHGGAWLDAGIYGLMAPGSNVPSGVRGFGHRDALTGIRERLVVNLTLKEDKLEDLHASLELAETFDSHTAEQRTRFFC